MDIIKRAGVAITPAALESCIDTHLKTQSCVLGLTHETLGQEPFAIAKNLNGKTKEEITEHVLEMFGKDYALGGIATLSELEMVGFPVNATGRS